MNLPKRPAPYILALLLTVLMLLVAWLFHALTSPALQQAVEERAKRPEPVLPAEPKS